MEESHRALQYSRISLNEANLRNVLNSVKPFLSRFGFKPSSVVDKVDWSRFPDLESEVQTYKNRNDDESATSNFIDLLLRENSPNCLSQLVSSLLTDDTNTSKMEEDKSMIRVARILVLSCAYLPLHDAVQQLLLGDNATCPSVEDMAQKLCRAKIYDAKMLSHILDVLSEDGPEQAVSLLFASVYDFQAEKLWDGGMLDCRPHRENSKTLLPYWLKTFLKILETFEGPKVGERIPTSVRSPDVWGTVKELLASPRHPPTSTEDSNDTGSDCDDSLLELLEEEREKGCDEDGDDQGTSSMAQLEVQSSLKRTSEYLNISPDVEILFCHQWKEPRASNVDSDDVSSVISATSSTSTEDNSLVHDLDESKDKELQHRFQHLSLAGGQITLHPYQEELLFTAREGKNVLIVLPTGTGKTYIVLKYTEEVLEKNGLNRVVFLAPKVKLAEQQFRRFNLYIQKGLTYFRSGQSRSSNAPFSELLERFKVFVMTPQCLVLAIQNKEICITDFSLLILDECHHTHAGHPYRVLMDLYLDAKFGKNTGQNKLPQVIGLTASPSIGKGGSIEVAIKNVKELCYAMDVEAICTVKKNEAALKAVTNEPKHHIHACPRRKKDKFKKDIENLMKDIEDEIVTCFNSLNLPDNRPLESIRSKLMPPVLHRGKPRYNNWVYGLSQPLANLATDTDSHVLLFSSIEMLQKYQRALILNEDCESKYALDYLKEQRDAMRAAMPSIGPVDVRLLDAFESRLPFLEKACQDTEDRNPKLRMLEDILISIYEKNENAVSCMVFVRTIELCKAIERWMTEHPELKNLKPGRITGSRVCNEQGGMTKNAISDVIDRFNSGDHKVVICTSAAEEGLDFQACNEVIRYDYVTSMVSMIQTRGRARHKNSRYHVVDNPSQSSIHKEQENQANENLMKRAVDSVQKSMEASSNDFRFQMNQWQRQKWNEFQKKQERVEQRLQVTMANTTKYTLLCGKCRREACSSDDLKLVEHTNRIVWNNDFRQKMRVEALPDATSFCQTFENIGNVNCLNCNFFWGTMARSKLSMLEYPVLKLERFYLKNADTGSLKKVKWSDCPFHVENLTDDEYASL